MNAKSDTAEYIAEMILALRNLAKGAEMQSLQGLLEIAYYEAFSVAHSPGVTDQEVQHLEELGVDVRRANVA